MIFDFPPPDDGTEPQEVWGATNGRLVRAVIEPGRAEIVLEPGTRDAEGGWQPHPIAGRKTYHVPLGREEGLPEATDDCLRLALRHVWREIAEEHGAEVPDEWPEPVEET